MNWLRAYPTEEHALEAITGRHADLIRTADPGAFVILVCHEGMAYGYRLATVDPRSPYDAPLLGVPGDIVAYRTRFLGIVRRPRLVILNRTQPSNIAREAA